MDTVVRLHPARGTRTVAPRSSEPEPLWREAVGRQLRDERHRRGERIADVADRAGISPQYLSELERGRKEASSEMLSAVAGALDLTVRDLVEAGARQLPGSRRGGQAAGGRVQLLAA
ncbi:MAG: helix-turn-helix domain-containing protein [Tomitella sp.]|uniref:helix-turn-helix domain-containing protein n=1 Tax=Intrasporangium sp. TaxID=1925024 RepID=UPI002647F142|nr:helix-turn-helix transcriptional regulator [Intrasporangium sp.]MDN5760682.1 helix-turn-helix domain-containing protein [Tomitella sp.]MDN5798218.1 helix-turn-helix domain-containing protein [Intrasporangium sp.]